MTPYEMLADAIRLKVDDEPDKLRVPVYENPVDSVEAPCVMVLAGPVTQASFGGNLSHDIRVNCIAQRADTPGGIATVDRLMKLVVKATAMLTSAAFERATEPQIFNIAGVDYMGREVRVSVTEVCSGG